jgi:hypothetical protein
MIFPVALVTVLFLASSVKAKGKHATGTSSSLRALQACDPSTCDLTGKTYQIAACEEGDCVFSCDDQVRSKIPLTLCVPSSSKIAARSSS